MCCRRFCCGIRGFGESRGAKVGWRWILVARMGTYLKVTFASGRHRFSRRSMSDVWRQAFLQRSRGDSGLSLIGRRQRARRGTRIACSLVTTSPAVIIATATRDVLSVVRQKGRAAAMGRSLQVRRMGRREKQAIQTCRDASVRIRSDICSWNIL